MTRNATTRRQSPSAPAAVRSGEPPTGTIQRSAAAANRFAAESYDSETRSAVAILSTGARVPRFDAIEELAIDREAIDLARIARGQVRLLDSHNQSSVGSILGIISDAWIEGGKLIGRLEFADTPAGRAAEGMVARGEATGISVGYRVSQWSPAGINDDKQIWRADRWELMEASLVSVPADPDALIRSAQSSHNTKGHRMDPEIIDDQSTHSTTHENDTSVTTRSAPRGRPAMSAGDVRDAYEMAERHRLPSDMVRRHVDAGGTMQEFRVLAFDHLAREADKTRTSPITPMFGGEDTFNNPEFLGRAISDALYAKMTGAPPAAAAAELMGRSMLEMGSMILRSRGERVSWADRNTIADRVLERSGGSHSTSDFPYLLASSGNRVMADAYTVAQTPLKTLARRRTASDYRPVSIMRLSEAARLEKVSEGGEIKHGSRGEAKEGFKIETYGKIFSISRQAIINDDLGAFGDTTAAFGRAAASTEADLIAALLLANGGDGTKLDDGNPVYTTTRGNKAAAGAAITVSALGAGRKVLRDMKDIDGKTPIVVTPKYLVTGSAKETEAEQVLHEIAATTVDDVNPFSGKLSLLVEPRLTGNAWRLFADPSQLATILIAYLDGRAGPQIDLRVGWDVLGVEFRAVLDFGCAMQDWRGTYLNPGA